jgi:ParB-like chromosome segregation protein Spo0J
MANVDRVEPVVNDETRVLTKHQAIRRHVLGLKEMSRADTSTKLSIAAIAIGERLIPEDPRVVAQLVISIRQTRQVTPILVRRSSVGYALIDGLNRIVALKQLDEIEVFACVLNLSDEEAKACEAISNSHRRHKLTALDRALTDFAFLQYIEKKVSQLATPSGGRQPKEKCHAKTARELGVSPDQIRRSRKIAKIAPYVQNAIRKNKLEDNQSVLLEIAASGDDAASQADTLSRIMNRFEQSVREPRADAQPDKSDGKYHSSSQSQSDKSRNAGAEASEVTPKGRQPSIVQSEEEPQGPIPPSSPSRSITSDEPRVSTFDAIKQEWDDATFLRHVLHESNQQDRRRFLDECVIPELFPSPAG